MAEAQDSRSGATGRPDARSPRQAGTVPAVEHETGHLTPEEIAAMDLAPDEVGEEEQLEEEVPEQVAIGKRFVDWRTLASFGVALVILVVAIGKAGINWKTTGHTLTHANLGF